MRQSVAMLMTVGVSLEENIQEKCLELKNKRINKKDLLLALNTYYDQTYNSLDNDIKTKSFSSINFPSAEIQSFCYLMEKEKDKVVLHKVILLPTKTEEAQKCAEQIKNILENQVFPALDIKFVNSIFPDSKPMVEIKEFELDIEDEKEFSQDCANFLDMLKSIVSELRINGIQQIILNITGGYKGLVPIFSLWGFVQEWVDVIYQHEKGMIIRVPALPLTWNFKLFDEFRSLLRRQEEITLEPPTKFRMLFEEKNGIWTKNPFGKFLEEVYIKERFKRFGHGARLMQKLPQDWQEDLENKLIPRWEYIWIGDQIPEVVEHSHGHSRRLLEYAADLLEPQFKKNPKFLEDHELYLLICSLWLHDIGHTGLEFKYKGKPLPISMFPSLVRKFHNLISYDRILNLDYLPTKEEREAVALISKYHRKALPLLRSENEWKDKDFEELKVPPLEQAVNSVKFKGKNISSNRLVLLCAILRVLDGLDVQHDRVINEYYWQERKQRTKEEVKHYHNLLSKKFQKVDECCKVWENAIDTQDEKELKELETKIEKMQNNIIIGLKDWMQKQNTKQAIVDLNDLSLIDRITFKMTTEAHFLKHSRVKLVYLTYDDTKYKINLVFDEKASLRDDAKEEIAKEIWEEIEAVKEILANNGIEFQGVFSYNDNKMLIP
ncbi:MAG: hypothetical protein ACE5KT_05290 [Methanosarcinales archaeon]